MANFEMVTVVTFAIILIASFETSTWLFVKWFVIVLGFKEIFICCCSQRFTLQLFLILVSSLKCWQCSSLTDKGCAPFDAALLGSSKLMECRTDKCGVLITQSRSKKKV